MKRLLSSALVLSFFALMAINSSYAQDWPKIYGPNGNSEITQDGLLESWTESGPEILWTTNVGIGYGGPVIKDNKAYLLDRDDEYGDIMRCFDMSTGAELWKYGYEAPGSVSFPGSRSVPAIDGDYIYSCGIFGDLYCIDLNTHQPVWNTNIWTGFGGEAPATDGGGMGGFGGGAGSFPTWAISQCPVVYKDMVIVAAQTPEVGVVAFDKLTGDIKWKTESLGGTGYVSPVIVNVVGEDQVVMVTATSGGGGFGGGEADPSVVAGINPQSGDVLWTYENWSCRIPSSSAYDAGNDKILIIGGYEAGAAMIQIEKNGSSYSVNEIYKNEDFGDHTKAPIFYDGYYYAQYTTNERRDGLVCMSEDGEVMWKTRREPVFNKGGMILVNDLILATDGETKLYLIEPDPSGFKPISSATLLSEGGLSDDPMSRFGGATQNWAPLAISDGKLLIRDQSQLKCVKVTQ